MSRKPTTRSDRLAMENFLRDFVKKQQKRIAELEAKFAESEKERRKAYQDGFFQKQFEKDVEICQLKQQLAEKDKETKQLKFDLGMFKSVNEFINRYGIEKAREVLLQTEKTKNQDKILFCIDKLKKVKEYNATRVFSNSLVDKFIDQQIEELRNNNEKILCSSSEE